MKNLFVFDLDGVAFYLGLYKRFLSQAAQQLGIDREVYLIAYTRSKQLSGIYNQGEHLRLLTEAGYDADALREAWVHMLAQCGPELVNLGFKECIAALDNNPDNKVVVITRGYQETQEAKIRYSGIGDLVKDIHYIVEGSKGSPIWSILRKHPECQRVIVAEDTMREIMDIRNFFHGIDVSAVRMTYFHFLWNTKAPGYSLAHGHIDPLDTLSPDIIPVRHFTDFSRMVNGLFGQKEDL